MNKLRQLLISLSVFILAITSYTSCSKDEHTTHTRNEASQEFVVTDVKSYENGNGFNLSLNFAIDNDQLKSLNYLEQEDTGELIGIQTSKNEKLHLFIRKEGDNNSLTVATIQWKQRANNKISLPNVSINLPQGVNANIGETWYIAGVLGGELNSATKEVQFGTSALNEAISTDTNNAVDMPYSFAWKRLEITKENKATLGETSLSPMGVLLRLQFYNNLIDAFEGSHIELKSNAFQAHGTFSPFAVENDNQQTSKKILWKALNPEDTTAKTWQYILGNNNRKLSLPSGSGRNAEHNIMLWVMPNSNIPEQDTETSIKLTAQRAGTNTPEVFETYHKTGHRPLMSGKSYRLSNLITAEPYISEVYYQYVTNPRNNYSIVEIYNPTIEDIDLGRYALVRTVQNAPGTSSYSYFATTHGPNRDLNQAAFLPLDLLQGYERSGGSVFPKNNTSYESNWHKVIYGEATNILKGGKTLLIGAGGYISTNYKPSANIERFNAQLDSYQAGQSTRSIEDSTLPRAGMQVDSAHKAGYAQAMIAIDNSIAKNRDPNPSGIAGVLQLGSKQGVALIKAQVNERGEYDYEVIDSSTPINNINATRSYILYLNSLRTIVPSNVSQATNYSQVRKAKVLKGNKTFDFNEWEWTICENDGIKSLGSRIYVAGLTPFASNYTGYDSKNNPQGLPFWSGAPSAPQLSNPKYNPTLPVGALPSSEFTPEEKAKMKAFEAHHLKKIFTDITCSELKEGITYKEIRDIPSLFYREMARKMYQGVYPREFRISDYQAWSDPELQRSENNTLFAYSILDNPTGIVAQSGSELLIFVGDTKGNDIRIRIMDLKKGNSFIDDGFSTAETHKLSEGINRVQVKTSGLIHVLYHIESKSIDRGQHPNVRIHFADGFGIVNGYYDSKKLSHQGRWAELLQKARHTYFEVLGEFAHLAFPTDYFRRNTQDANQLISIYDKLVKGEMELMGLYHYNRVFTNRAFFHVMYYSNNNMFAHRHRTFYSAKAMEIMTNPQILERNIWGAAHEVGHLNQTFGLRWEGLEEISGNITATYVYTNIFGNRSNLLKKKKDGFNAYKTAWEWAFVKQPTHAAIKEESSKFVPFWQLELYFGKLMGRNPINQKDKGGFYPDLYERLRGNNHFYSNPNYHQAEFAYHISKVSGYDMTDFCERWGFLRAANNVEAMKNHGELTFRFTLPQSVVNEVKQRIKDLNLPKPSPVIHLISDINYSYFHTPIREVVRGTVSRLGNVVSLSNWKNVVCYVVTNAQGQDIYYNEGKSAPEDTVAELTSDGFTWDETGIRLYSIDANGKRTPIPLP